MSDTYAVVLRECPEGAQPAAADALARTFGIKEATCQNVVGSTPIVLVDGLSQDEAAVLQLAMNGLAVAGASLEFTNQADEELPRINWPKQPQVFRFEIAKLVEEFAIDLPGGALLDQLRNKLTGKGTAAVTAHNREVFSEADLGEITPFSNTALPTIPSVEEQEAEQSGQSGSVPVLNGASEEDLLNRMDELFPDDGDGIIPNTQDITNMLNKLLPDEEGGGAAASGGQPAQGGGQAAGSGRQPAAAGGGGGGGGGGHSVFLAKISDENRRKKAIPLLVELIGISEDEAEKLAKKVIIPVLKGVTKEDAEQAKHRFAEIGVLARIKGG